MFLPAAQRQRQCSGTFGKHENWWFVCPFLKLAGSVLVCCRVLNTFWHYDSDRFGWLGSEQVAQAWTWPAVLQSRSHRDRNGQFVSSTAWRLPSKTVQESETFAVEKGAEETKKTTGNEGSIWGPSAKTNDSGGDDCILGFCITRCAEWFSSKSFERFFSPSGWHQEISTWMHLCRLGVRGRSVFRGVSRPPSLSFTLTFT